jgi:hypothetical protein
MCRSVHVRLAPSERRQTVRLSGILLPVYASIALVIFVSVYVAHTLRGGGTVTASSSPAPSVQAIDR